MEIKKIFTWVPIMAAVLGTLYTGINTIIKLNNTIEQHTLQLREMSTTISAIDERFSIEVKNLNRAYTEGREEVFQEMTNVLEELEEKIKKVEQKEIILTENEKQLEKKANEKDWAEIDKQLEK